MCRIVFRRPLTIQRFDAVSVLPCGPPGTLLIDTHTMANDREILREIWEGKIPVHFKLSPDETDVEPEEYFLLIPRLSYFPLVTDKVSTVHGWMDGWWVACQLKVYSFFFLRLGKKTFPTIRVERAAGRGNVDGQQWNTIKVALPYRWVCVCCGRCIEEHEA